MKNLLIKRLFLLTTLLVGFFMISCSDDESKDDPVPTTPDVTVKNVSLNYSVSLAKPYYDYFDVTVEYTHEGGLVKQEAINNNWNKSYTMSYEEAPENIVCKVDIVPKNPLPAIEDGVNYRIDGNITANVAGYTAEGVQNKNFGWNGRFSASGEKTTREFEIYTSKSHNLLNFSYQKGSPNPTE